MPSLSYGLEDSYGAEPSQTKDSRGKRQYLGPEDFIEQNFYMRKNNFSCFKHC